MRGLEWVDAVNSEDLDESKMHVYFIFSATAERFESPACTSLMEAPALAALAACISRITYGKFREKASSNPRDRCTKT